MEKYLPQFWDDFEEYQKVAEKLEQKKVNLAEYKSISTGFGSYVQRGGNKQMLRLRLTGGRLLLEQMKCIIQCCREYQVNTLKISTGQSLQLHDLSLDAVLGIIPKVWKAGIITRGSGGNYPNNVMVSPLSGVEENEYFDVLPYAEVTAKYLMKFIDIKTFPRKLKVSFANSNANIPHTSVRDLGFIANSDYTFQVYMAGGLGPNPKVGVLIDEHVLPKDILYYVKTMITIFTTYGNFEQRNRARSRYLQDTLGIDSLKELFHQHLNRYKKIKNHELQVCPIELQKRGKTSCKLNNRIFQQKQLGLYYVSYHPIGGYLSLEQFERLYQLISKMDKVEIRLNPEGGMYIINCNAEEAMEIFTQTKDGASSDFEASVSCVGCAKCAIGVTDSQKLLHTCINIIKNEHFSNGILPQIHISGCVSSCASHQLSVLGLQGTKKRTDDGVKPAYIIYMGGCQEQYNEKIAKKYSAILEEDVPTFLLDLGYQVQADNSTFEQWLPTHQTVFEEILHKYIF